MTRTLTEQKSVRLEFFDPDWERIRALNSMSIAQVGSPRSAPLKLEEIRFEYIKWELKPFPYRFSGTIEVIAPVLLSNQSWLYCIFVNDHDCDSRDFDGMDQLAMRIETSDTRENRFPFDAGHRMFWYDGLDHKRMLESWRRGAFS